MAHHKLKIAPEYFEEVVLGNKTFELRFNDRNYQRGDTFDLMEWNSSEFTNRSVSGEITYVFTDEKKFGLDSGYCVFCFKLKNINL